MFGKIEILRRLIDVNEILEETIEDIPELELTQSQQKLILYLIKKSDDKKEYDYIPIKTVDFCTIFNIEQNDNMYERINEEIKDLSYKIFLMPIMNIRPRKMCMWIAGGYVDFTKDTVNIKLSETFRPYYKYLKNKLEILN